MLRLTVDDTVTEADSRGVWPVYEAVFGDFPNYDAWRDGMWNRHRAREGFRLARALDGDDLVAVAWGYTGQDGQWRTDQARRVLAPEVADLWLGGHFELVSIGVVERGRGSGVGSSLLQALLAGLPHERLLLMTTSDDTDSARRLYASAGWRVIGPGIGQGSVIMGRQNAQ